MNFKLLFLILLILGTLFLGVKLVQKTQDNRSDAASGTKIPNRPPSRIKRIITTTPVKVYKRKITD